MDGTYGNPTWKCPYCGDVIELPSAGNTKQHDCTITIPNGIAEEIKSLQADLVLSQKTLVLAVKYLLTKESCPFECRACPDEIEQNIEECLDSVVAAFANQAQVAAGEK